MTFFGVIRSCRLRNRMVSDLKLGILCFGSSKTELGKIFLESISIDPKLFRCFCLGLVARLHYLQQQFFFNGFHNLFVEIISISFRFVESVINELLNQRLVIGGRNTNS